MDEINPKATRPFRKQTVENSVVTELSVLTEMSEESIYNLLFAESKKGGSKENDE